MKPKLRAALLALSLLAGFAASWAVAPASASADCGPTQGLCGNGVADTMDCDCGDGTTFTCACNNAVPDTDNCGPVDCGSCSDCSVCPGNAGCECYGNTDPCCGSTDPCCGSADPCCGSTDPCCDSGDPCCGSEDPCCGLTDKDLACCMAPGSVSCTCYGLTGHDWDCCADPQNTQNCGDYCGDGVCGEGEDCITCEQDCNSSGECDIYGCMDENASNYDPLANAGCESGGDDCCEYDDECPPGTPNPKPEGGGNYTCCGGSWEDSASGECCTGDFWCASAGGNKCHDRNSCHDASGNPTDPRNKATPGGTCGYTDTICAVASASSCSYDSNCNSDCGGGCCPGDPGCGGQDYSWGYTIALNCPSSVSGAGQSGITAFSGSFGAHFDEPVPTEQQAYNAGQIAVFGSGDFCNMYVGDDGSASGFYYNVTNRDTCFNLGGNQETVPAGYTQDGGGNCCPVGQVMCLDGTCGPDVDGNGMCDCANDADNDGVCDCADIATAAPDATCDVCNDIADPAIYNANLAIAAGLNPDGNGNCPCGQTNQEYSYVTHACEPVDLCTNVEGTQATVPAGLVRNNDGTCTCGDPSEKICLTTGTCIANTDCCDATYTYCSQDQTCYPTVDYDKLCIGCTATNANCCGANPPAWCVTTIDTCYSNPQLTSSCVTAYNASGSYGQHGTILPPLASSAIYTHQQLEAIFAKPLAAQATTTTTRRPIYGIVRAVAQGGTQTCDVTPCNYGDACVESADPATRKTFATCLPAAQIATTTATTTDIVNLVRAAQIHVVPTLIPVSGQCLVLWTAQGMTSCSVAGPDLSVAPGDDDQFAGFKLASPGGGSATYTITCDGGDGYQYKATDSCNENPGILEF